MVSGEDCLSAESASSAAAPYAALRPREICGSGVAFFLDTFLGLCQEKVSRKSRESDGFNGVQN